jgi:transcription initiation factor TFIIH subunit 1
VDPRPETVDGEIKIKITPQLVHDIFDEYPVVAKAYIEHVPKNVWYLRRWLHVTTQGFNNIAV